MSEAVQFIDGRCSLSLRYLKPDENKKSKHKTAVKKKTLNPEFNEVINPQPHHSQAAVPLQPPVIWCSTGSWFFPPAKCFIRCRPSPYLSSLPHSLLPPPRQFREGTAVAGLKESLSEKSILRRLFQRAAGLNSLPVAEWAARFIGPFF